MFRQNTAISKLLTETRFPNVFVAIGRFHYQLSAIMKPSAITRRDASVYGGPRINGQKIRQIRQFVICCYFCEQNIKYKLKTKSSQKWFSYH